VHQVGFNLQEHIRPPVLRGYLVSVDKSFIGFSWSLLWGFLMKSCQTRLSFTKIHSVI